MHVRQYLSALSHEGGKEGRTQAEVHKIILWLRGYSTAALAAQLEKQVDLETFLGEAPAWNPARALITGSVCGIRMEAIEEP